MGIYLDNAAISFPKPKEVATAVYDFMINNGTSSGRGSYKKQCNQIILFMNVENLLEIFLILMILKSCIYKQCN